jgi:hypothetical protein
MVTIYSTINPRDAVPTWTVLGTIPGEDIFGRCDDFNGLMGLMDLEDIEDSRIFSGARTRDTGQPCLRSSNTDGVNWGRIGGNIDIWAALPGSPFAYIATSGVTPDIVSACINADTGLIQPIATTGLADNYRIWSLANHSTSKYAAAFWSASGEPQPTVIMRLEP